jgi:2-haloalkanoic acid dehalogenase type II
LPIRAVTFDADDTLWDFQEVSLSASRILVERVSEIHPGHSGTVEDLLQARIDMGQSSPQGTSFALIRRMAIERFVDTHVGGPNPDLVDHLTELFFAHRDAAAKLFPDVEPMLDRLPDELVLGVITNGNTTWKAMSIADRFQFWLAADQTGIRKPDPRLFRMAAAAAGCRPRELVHVGDEPHSDVVGARRAGVRSVWINRAGLTGAEAEPDAEVASLAELPDLLARWDEEEKSGVGVGPHERPWPDDQRLDPELLAEGDRRNVVDRFRYWKREAIVEELDRTRHPFHVAIENWRHDLNIGTIVRTANAFGAAGVHIVGHRRWNRRGAMVTDRYQHVHHHQDVVDLLAWAEDEDLEVIGIDNLAGSEPLELAELPCRCLFVFGQEGTGLSDAARSGIDRVFSITQFGSTRSINAGVAAGIAMHAWIRQHAAL